MSDQEDEGFAIQFINDVQAEWERQILQMMSLEEMERFFEKIGAKKK